MNGLTLQIGKDQWNLQVDDVDLDLVHFQQWIASWDTLGKTDLHVPAVDWQSVWQSYNVFRSRDQIRIEVEQSFKNASDQLPHDVAAWIIAYNAGQ